MEIRNGVVVASDVDDPVAREALPDRVKVMQLFLFCTSAYEAGLRELGLEDTPGLMTLVADQFRVLDKSIEERVGRPSGFQGGNGNGKIAAEPAPVADEGHGGARYKGSQKLSTAERKERKKEQNRRYAAKKKAEAVSDDQLTHLETQRLYQRRSHAKKAATANGDNIVVAMRAAEDKYYAEIGKSAPAEKTGGGGIKAKSPKPQKHPVKSKKQRQEARRWAEIVCNGQASLDAIDRHNLWKFVDFFVNRSSKSSVALSEDVGVPKATFAYWVAGRGNPSEGANENKCRAWLETQIAAYRASRAGAGLSQANRGQTFVSEPESTPVFEV